MSSTQNGQNPVGRISKRERGIFGGIFAAVLVLVGLSLFMIPHLKTGYSLKQFLPANHPLLKADLETRKRFFLDESQPILVTLDLPAGGDWLETKHLEELGRVTAELEKHDGVKGALSLASISLASQSKDELAVGLLTKISDVNVRRARVANDKFLNPILISSDLHRTLVVVSVVETKSTEFFGTLMDDIRNQYSVAIPDAHVSIGGVPAIQTRLTSMVRSELTQFMGLALFASCLTLMLVFSSAWSAIVPFFAIIIANIFVLAFMAWAGMSMSVLAVTIPILVSIAVLSLCAHTMLRFVEEVHRFEGTPKYSKFTPKASLVFETLRSLFSTNLLTSVITCFGFATLLVTDVPLIREFGLTVAVSTLISWLSTTAVLAPMLAILPVPVARPWVLREATWVSMVFVYRRSIVTGVLIFCTSMAFIGRNLHFSARLFDDLPQKEEARVATENIDKSLGGTIPFEVLVDTAGQDPWNDPTAVQKMDTVLATLRKHVEVGSAIGLPDLFRQAAGNPTAALPTKRASIAEGWFMLSMSENSPLKQFITSDGSTARVAMRLRDMPSDQVQAAMKTMVAEVSAAFPGSKVTTGGMATTVHTLNNELSVHLMESFWHALLVITVLLFFVFRSWRWTLTAVLPNLVPATVLVGVLALTKTPIKPGVALVFSIALGIAFINTVYLLQRLRGLMKETGQDAHELIEKTLRLEGNPCLVSSFCVLAGFGIFLASEFGINRTFGMYMLISLAFGLIGDLVFLPALIKLFPSILGSTPKPPQANLDSSDESNDKEIDFMVNSGKKSFPRAAASVAFLASATFGAALLATPPAHAALDANVVLKTVATKMDSKDESATLKMKVVDANGSSKERELEIKRKSGDKNEVLVRVKAPSDLSGIAVLSVASNGKEEHWLYTPSARKARLIVGGNKSQALLDTEFSVEDFTAATYAHFTNTVLKEERAPSASVAVIESKAKDKSTSYSKILTWVDLATYQLQKSEYYDQNGKLLKTMVFRDYKKYGSTWRAQSIEVRNMQNNRSTVLTVAALKINSGLSDREFTQAALEDN